MDQAAFDFNSILGLGFTAWAGVVAFFGIRIIKKLDDTSDALQRYIVQTETRLAVLEDRVYKE